MSKENSIGKIPELIRKLGDVRGLFLNENISVNAQPEEFQKALGTIWDIASVFYPEGRSGSVRLSVPSQRLIELGLVSKKVRERIKTKESRKREAEDVRNFITLESFASEEGIGFLITETYLAEAEFHGEARLDSVVEERTFLIRDTDDKLQIKIEKGESNSHLHALGEIWVSREKKASREYKLIETTSRRINTTLALLAEGLAPGYIKSA